MSTSETLLSIVQTFFNDPNCSDIILNFNDEKYYLMSKLIKHYAPGLHTEIELLPVPATPTITPDLSPDQLLASLTTFLSKNSQKKTINITDPHISKDTLTSVLESMYGKSLEVSSLNLNETYLLATKFDMKELVKKCMDDLNKALSNPITFLDSYHKAIEESSPFIQMYQDAFMEKIAIFPKEKIFVVTNKLDYDTIVEFIKSDKLICNEDLIYDIVENWRLTHSDIDDTQSRNLYDLVKLELLTVNFLMTKVKGNSFISSERHAYAVGTSAMNFIECKQNHKSRNSRVPISVSVFGVGKLHEAYKGYRLVTKQDIANNKFKQLLQSDYEKINGFYCLDNFLADVICCAPYEPFAISSGGWVRYRSKNLEKGNILQAQTSHDNEAWFKAKIDTMCVSDNNGHDRDPRDAGLFVANYITF